MYYVFNCIANEHDFIHVLMATLVLSFSSACAQVVLLRSLVALSRRGQIIWMIAAGTVMGIGAWAMHFIALLGYRPGFPVEFDGWITILSPLITIAGFIATAALLTPGKTASTPVMTGARRLGCAIFATASVAAMHFFGMSALKASAIIEYDPATNVAAFGIGFICFSVTYFAGLLRSPRLASGIAWLSSLFAVASIHFIGAAGTTLIPVKGLVAPVWVLSTGNVGFVIALGAGLILIVAALAVGLDRLIQSMRTQEKRKLSLLADSALEGLFVVSSNGKVIEANLTAQTMLDKSRDALCGRQITDLLQMDDLTDLSLLTDQNLPERSLTFANGSRMIVDIKSRAISDNAGSFIVFAVHDQTDRIRNEAKVRALAYRDVLTGLANRVTFNMALSSAIKNNPAATYDLAVMIIDIDDFKEVNDQFGHQAGDLLLKTVARRMARCLNKGDLVARLSGDEFAVLKRDCTDKAQIAATARALLEAISEPVKLGQRTLSVGASIGISVGVPHSGGLTRVLTSADRALYSAKKAGRGCYRFYDRRLHREHEDRRTLEAALHNAIMLEQFELHYQPKVCSRTRAIVGQEALIRWHRPDHGLVYPDQFIPIAEQSLLINQIGKWTLRAACEAAVAWDENITIAVNLSARQFLDPDLVENVRLALSGSGITPSRLELEITETALIQNTLLAVAVLNELKVIGVQIALDDFGTGYSSMSYVQIFPFDRIKIDRSFVAAMNADHKSRAIVESIIHLAHALRMPVVAEGVETEDQAAALSRLGCEELQGYLIARPQPLAIDHSWRARPLGVSASDAA